MIAGAALAEYQESEGRKLAIEIFDEMTGGKDQVDLGDIVEFNEGMMSAMDANGDKKVTLKEFRSWDPGFAAIAEKEGRQEGYQTALKLIYSFWDRNGNGELTQSEFKRAMSVDFRRADLDDNDILTKEEFLRGFSVMVAMRAAIRPDLDI